DAKSYNAGETPDENYSETQSKNYDGGTANYQNYEDGDNNDFVTYDFDDDSKLQLKKTAKPSDKEGQFDISVEGVYETTNEEDSDFTFKNFVDPISDYVDVVGDPNLKFSGDSEPNLNYDQEGKKLTFDKIETNDLNKRANGTQYAKFDLTYTVELKDEYKDNTNENKLFLTNDETQVEVEGQDEPFDFVEPKVNFISDDEDNSKADDESDNEADEETDKDEDDKEADENDKDESDNEADETDKDESDNEADETDKDESDNEADETDKDESDNEADETDKDESDNEADETDKDES